MKWLIIAEWNGSETSREELDAIEARDEDHARRKAMAILDRDYQRGAKLIEVRRVGAS